MTDTPKEKNKGGRPPGSTRKSSQLKSVLMQLKRMSPKALENIDESVKGIVVDKDVLASSKWVVNTLTTVHKAVVAEEEQLNMPKDNDAPDGEEEVEKPRNFSLVRVPRAA